MITIIREKKEQQCEVRHCTSWLTTVILIIVVVVANVHPASKTFAGSWEFVLLPCVTTPQKAAYTSDFFRERGEREYSCTCGKERPPLHPNVNESADASRPQRVAWECARNAAKLESHPFISFQLSGEKKKLISWKKKKKKKKRLTAKTRWCVFSSATWKKINKKKEAFANKAAQLRRKKKKKR